MKQLVDFLHLIIVVLFVFYFYFKWYVHVLLLSMEIMNKRRNSILYIWVIHQFLRIPLLIHISIFCQMLLEGSRGLVSVFPNQQRKLHTTKTWDFLGFPQNVKRKAKLESNLVAGLIDTGITPVSESFNDKGFGAPPAKWKGSCCPYANFSCNNVTWSYQHL
ncbi:subtilisin-like protease SBT4.8 [Papaver somniferum]|uniref:subtilisin-like protease SBT4.8 n=1 Tax=Papaver somniferum TaxID=3469 RepID=UPI000E6F5C6F|nr:subtilisin-like protease SBT4.8 [Papaver somniferum]